jgi:DNA-binding SARP family transcriptional activator/tetratricopeptide (TPR) repeat protein
MAIEFRLLGEVRASVNGQPIDLGHARQRCVLAALLVDVNRVVPVDQLLDRIWAQRPPQRSRTTLSSYLSRLRQALAATSEVSLTRRDGGYMIAGEPMTIDLHRFRRLVGEARTDEDPARAAELFAEALRLWRGEAFAALETPWLTSVRQALDLERHAAELDRIDLALALGDHAVVLADVSRLAAAHPFDERVAGQAMLALYRCGRQADALFRYDEVRRRLAAELGADPSPPLRALHQRILTSDPTLAGPDAATATVLHGRSRADPVPRGHHRGTADPIDAIDPPAAVNPPAAAGPTQAIDQPAAGGPASVAGPTEAAGPTVAPRQLPPPPRSFTGRTHELAELDSILAAAAPDRSPTTVVISAVSGTAGVGKTALALHWAHRVADRFPDGQLYVNLRGFDPGGSVMTVAEAVRGFLDALEVPPHRLPGGLDAQIGLYRSLTARRRMLVVLDNARDTAQVRPLLPGGPGCLVVVTSRDRLTGLVAAEGAQPVSLDLLTEYEAWDLLAERVGADRVAAEPGAATDIIERCARLPLALTIAAARAATRPRFPLAALARDLGDARSALRALAEADPTTDVRAAFACSYQALSRPAARLFRYLGLHPGPEITAAAAASLAGVWPEDVRATLTELTRAHLIVEATPHRYTFHDLLRAYAAELVETTEPEQKRDAVTRRLLDHYLHTAYAAVRLLEPQRERIDLDAASPGVHPEALADARQAIGWLMTEHEVLLGCVTRAADGGFDTHTWQLPWTLTALFERRRRWDDQVTIQTGAVAAARRLGDRAGQAYSHRNLARAHARLARYDEAYDHLHEAMDLFVALGDNAGQANTHLSLSWTHDQQNQHAQALVHDRRALDLFREVADRLGQATALNNVGWRHGQLGRHLDAITYCRQALALYQEIGNGLGEANTWDSLGFVHSRLGDHDRAAECYRHAADRYRDNGHRYNEADALAQLGDALAAGGELDEAVRAWRAALAILVELDHPDADGLRDRLDAQPRRSAATMSRNQAR